MNFSMMIKVTFLSFLIKTRTSVTEMTAINEINFREKKWFLFLFIKNRTCLDQLIFRPNFYLRNC